MMERQENCKGWLVKGCKSKGKARDAKARDGKARSGKARSGNARSGKARSGKATDRQARVSPWVNIYGVAVIEQLVHYNSWFRHCFQVVVGTCIWPDPQQVTLQSARTDTCYFTY